MSKLFYLIPVIIASCSGLNDKDDFAKKEIVDSTWKKQTITDLLTVSLPDSSFSEKEDVTINFYGTGKLGQYGVRFIDSAFMLVPNERMFQAISKGYLSNMVYSDFLNSYDLLIVDTTMGNSSGYFISGPSVDSSSVCPFYYCYFTVANSRPYSCYVCQIEAGMTAETKQFFNSIQFKPDGFDESKYEVYQSSIRKKPYSYRSEKRPTIGWF